MVKAPLAQEAVSRNPTDRGEKGTKHHLLVDGRGVPLSLVVTGANRHDVTQLEYINNFDDLNKKSGFWKLKIRFSLIVFY